LLPDDDVSGKVPSRQTLSTARPTCATT